MLLHGWPFGQVTFSQQKPTTLQLLHPVKTKLPALGLSCWKVLTHKVPLKESDNLPQVGRTQTSPAAKLILNSALTRNPLQDLRICLGQLLLWNFSFLSDCSLSCYLTAPVSCQSAVQLVGSRRAVQNLNLVYTTHIPFCHNRLISYCQSQPQSLLTTEFPPQVFASGVQRQQCTGAGVTRQAALGAQAWGCQSNQL